jgi:hypothetical protein
MGPGKKRSGIRVSVSDTVAATVARFDFRLLPQVCSQFCFQWIHVQSANVILLDRPHDHGGVHSDPDNTFGSTRKTVYTGAFRIHRTGLARKNPCNDATS